MREDELYELLSGAGDAAFVVDPDGLIRFWNRSAEALFGAPSAAVLKKPCAVVMDGVDSAGQQLCVTNCTVQQMSERCTQIPAYDLEVRTASGSRKWVNVSVIVADTGGSRLLIHLVRDAEDQKRLANLARDIVAVANRVAKRRDPVTAGSQNPRISLTAQERRILQLLSQGRGTDAIARELHVSAVTVRNHVQHVLGKLGAHSRLEAVMRAVREKLI